MSDTDIQTLRLILEKEADFKNEVQQLAALFESDILQDSLSDYLSEFDDLKNDFLIPAKEKLTLRENTSSASMPFTDKYWYFQRT